MQVCLSILLLNVAAAEAYDPLEVADVGVERPVDLTVKDAERDREIPVRAYLPATGSAAPVILFSHGLGGSRNASPYLGQHWAARGYAAVFLQHVGSDKSIWKGVERSRRTEALRDGTGPQQFLDRVNDVTRVLDQLADWTESPGHAFAGRLNMDRVGMSGHSFGAVTTQAVSGQKTGRRSRTFADNRIRAAVALSPSPPRVGDPAAAFGSVQVPWMLMTGTKDGTVLGGLGATPERRRDVYPHLPDSVPKYEVILHNAEHSAFGDRRIRQGEEQRNPNHHRVVLALSTAFWDTYLKEDPAAAAWLHGDGPRSVMEEADKWQFAARREE